MERELELVKEAVERFELLRGDEKVVLAYSGGPDSTFALLALRELYPALRITLAHLNHGIRPEAEREEEWVRQLAENLKLPLEVRRVSVPQLAKERGIGLEEAGRLARREFLYEVAQKTGAAAIATGHTLTDWAETLLLNLMRGAGLRGLAPMPPKEGLLVRPVILLAKEEIEGWLRRHGVPFLVDRSNYSLDFKRNWVRWKLLPLIREGSPGWPENLRRALITGWEARQFIEAEAEKALSFAAKPSPSWGRVFSRERLLVYNKFLVKAALQKLAPEAGFVHLEAAWEALVKGGEVHLPGVKLQVSEGEALFYRQMPQPWRGELVISRVGAYEVPELNLKLYVSPRPLGGVFEASFPQSALPLSLRTRRPGDRFGKKPLKKLLIDLKIPRWRRDWLPLLAKGKDVLWVVGFKARPLEGEPRLYFSVSKLEDGFWVYDN